ncbi:MAG: FAD-binding protein, partial [Peptococcaceae bacterium]
VPAQHYHMGGIAVNMASQTTMTGLYAVGEASCNGVHGRNRLASNSLLESLVFAQRAADDILFGSHHPGCSDCITDMKAYGDLETMAKRYRTAVLEAMEN